MKQIWFEYVHKHILIPVPILEAGSVLKKRLAGSSKPHMECRLDLHTWDNFCELHLKFLYIDCNSLYFAPSTSGQIFGFLEGDLSVS